MTFDIIKKRCVVNDVVSFKTKSGDSFSGTVLEIDEDTVIIQNADGDEEYIPGSEIVSFKKHVSSKPEAASNPITETSDAATTEATKVPLNETSEDKEEKETKHVEQQPASSIIESKPGQPGHVIGWIDLDKVDPHKGKRPNIKHDPRELALLDQPEATLDKRLSSFVSSYKSEDENDQMIEACGYIVADNVDKGYIWDQGLESEIGFIAEDICDDVLYDCESWVGKRVSYIKINDKRGVKAVGITLPRPVYEILALADDLSDDPTTKQNAYDLLQDVLAHNPENEDAKYLIHELKGAFKKRQIHSLSMPLDLDALKEAKTYDPKSHDKSVEKNKKATEEYTKAKQCVNNKQHKEALQHYLKAYEAQKSVAYIKDIGMQYCTLCSKKYIESHPEDKPNVYTYRREGAEFLKSNVDRLPKGQSTYHFLESTYYVLHEYDKYLAVVDRLIETKGPSQRVIFLNKKAVVLLALKRKHEAEDVINQVLRLDSSNNTARRLKEQILGSNEDLNISDLLDGAELSDNPIGAYLSDTIERYTDFVGVVNYVRLDEARLYSKPTYDALVDLLDESDVQSDSARRSPLLLTKIKLDMRMNNGAYDKRDVALYCNDMARVSMLKDPNSIKWDVVRFYFNESFSLTTDWSSNRRQFIQYLETLIPDKKDAIFGKLPQGEQENRMKQDIHDLVLNCTPEFDWLNSLLHPSLYNEQIANRVISAIYDDEQLRKSFAEESSLTGKTLSSNDAKEKFETVWYELIEERFASERALCNSFLARLEHSSLQKLTASMDSLQQECRVSWLSAQDSDVVRETFKVLIPKIEAFNITPGFINKENNYQDSSRILQGLIHTIREYPTKFSYEAVLPLLLRFQILLKEAWENIVISSEPNLNIALLTEYAYKDENNTVALQIEVANDKDSSPVSRLSISIAESPEIDSWRCVEGEYLEMLKGGDDPIIFHIELDINKQYVEAKAISISVICSYESTNNTIENCEKALSVRFYSESEYEPFDNPYNAGDTVENRDMFFGRDAFISNLVNVMKSSKSKQLVFYGQKRSGKSSVLYWLENELKNSGAFCVRFSLGILRSGGDISSASFFYLILKNIHRALRRIQGEKPDFTIPTPTEFEAENPTNPGLSFASYMIAFKDACKETPGWENKLVVIMIDEFTYLYTGIKQGTVNPTILQQWKSVIQDPDSSFASVLVGQDVIPYFKNEVYAKNVFQMMEAFRLNYLDEVDARALVESPIGKDRYASGAVETILDFSACNPYYIQLICSNLVGDMNKKHSMVATKADVDVTANKIISSMDQADFDNLISPGDAIEIEGISEKTLVAVLYRIAILTKSDEFCSETSIAHFFKDELLENELELVRKVLDNLKAREVIEDKAGLYRIKVKLFQQWLQNQSPELASIKEHAL